MKPRLFWTTLAAFVLAIVLGICGMLGFVSLAFAGVWEPGGPRPFPDMRPSYAAFLADYYVAHGGAWSGLDQRLAALESSAWGSAFSAVVADASGRVVASGRSSLVGGQVVEAATLARGTPITVGGARVGTLLVRAVREDRAPSFVWPVVRAFLGAGLGLAAVLTGLAVLFARWLSAPLRRTTLAAQALAGGRLDVQVQGARVRELDDLARAFNRMATALDDADKQRRQMTADIAHELRTPLTIIKGRLEGVQDGVYQPTPEQIGGLLGEVSLLERLIEDLRVLALAEAGQLPLYTETLDARDLLDSAAAAFAERAAAQSVALHVEAPADLPPISADPQRMAQVLANLVANALRYTPAGGSVTLAACADDRRPTTDDRPLPATATALVSHAITNTSMSPPVVGRRSSVVVSVTDTGSGIAEADLPHVFDRFYRGDRARGRSSGGAGLGLAIAKQIVAAHGGTISAERNAPHGTTVRITLPAADDE